MRRLAARQITGAIGAAPELRPIQIRPEAIGALRQGEDHLSTCIRRSVVASVGGIGACKGEGIHRQPGLDRPFSIFHRHCQWDGHGNICACATWQAAGIGRPAPELGPIKIRSEAVITLK
jgi:hypothetical protein